MDYRNWRIDRRETFENVSLKKRRVELKRLVTVLNHMLVELQLAVTEGSIAETNIQKREINQSPKKIIKEIEDRRGSKKILENCALYEPDVLDGERLREERVDDSDSLGPVPRATELGELDSLRDSWAAHELTRTSWAELSGVVWGSLCLGSFLRFNGFERERERNRIQVGFKL